MNWTELNSQYVCFRFLPSLRSIYFILQFQSFYESVEMGENKPHNWCYDVSDVYWIILIFNCYWRVKTIHKMIFDLVQHPCLTFKCLFFIWNFDFNDLNCRNLLPTFSQGHKIEGSYIFVFNNQIRKFDALRIFKPRIVC